jgi:S1-C subfamily serine protease
MRIFFTSLLSGILGAVIVYGAFTVAPPSGTPVLAPENINLSDTARPLQNREGIDPGTLTAQEVYEQYGKAVVHVKASVTNTYENFFGLPVPENQISSGSGFIVARDGYVITNAHVVSGADEITVQFSDQAEEKASLVGIDQSTDLAVLKTDTSNHDTGILALADSQNAAVGQTVYAIGNPLGYDRSMSRGIISALNRVINAPNGIEIRGVIQTDAAVNQGNSGGPLLTATGKVIGVTSQIATTGAGNIGIAFAIPSSIVKRVFTEIKETGKTARPWLGISGATVDSNLAEELGLKTKSGAIIVSIIDPGPARAAGLKEADRQMLIDGDYREVGGDIITKINGKRIDSMESLVNEVNQYRAGEKITLTILRNDKFQQIKIVLDERPQKFNELNLDRR